MKQQIGGELLDLQCMWGLGGRGLALYTKLIFEHLSESEPLKLEIVRSPQDWVKVIIRGNHSFWETFYVCVVDDRRLFLVPVKTYPDKPHVRAEYDCGFEAGALAVGLNDIVRHNQAPPIGTRTVPNEPVAGNGSGGG